MSSGTQNVHYTLLSAFCCGKPGLQFQFAKLKLESEIIRFSKRSTSNANQTILSYSIVRPTAFFKSLDGQLESARNGKPIIYFGDGSCSANPIGETDLANYLIDCATMPKSINMINEIRNIGGPDVPPITKRQQGEMIYDTLGIPKNKRKFVSVPVKIFDILIGFFTTSQAISTALNKSEWVKRCEDAAELTRIVKYYAVEPMVATGHNEVIGTMKLSDHFKSIAERGGELLEIDRMTTTSGVLSSFANNDI
jgi:divinyl chlorophyllide a 8-vinyl-reductase